MTVRTDDWDASEYLETHEDVSEYLIAIMEEGAPRRCRWPWTKSRWPRR